MGSSGLPGKGGCEAHRKTLFLLSLLLIQGPKFAEQNFQTEVAEKEAGKEGCWEAEILESLDTRNQ